MNLKWNKKFIYPTSTRSLLNDERVYDVSQEKLPSVTTILSATQPQDKLDSLARWKAKVGDVEADKIKNLAANRGTIMHSILEGYILEKEVLDMTEAGVQAHSMAKTIIDKGLPDLEEIWGSEVVVSYPGLYAGATDLVGVYMGRDSIIDFKQSNKPKRIEWITDYKLQMVAYAMAHNYVHDSEIEQGVILMCTPDNFFQRFIINGSEFRALSHEWLARVDAYYKVRAARSESRETGKNE